MKPLTLQRLQVFCAVYEHGSITAAAQQLKLTQPTVSRHLRDFEMALGMSLFVLDKGRIFATTQADAVYLESRFLQEGINRISNRIDNLREGADSTISLMSVGLFSSWPLPSAIASLLRDMPHLELKINVGTAEQQFSMLRAGAIDVGISAGEIYADDLVLTRIGHGRLVAVVPKSMPTAICHTASLEELAQDDLIPLSSKGPIGRVLNRELMSRGINLNSSVVGYSIPIVPYLAETLKRPAIIDNFTARELDPNRFRIVQLEECISFEVQILTSNVMGAKKLAVTILENHLKKALLSQW